MPTHNLIHIYIRVLCLTVLMTVGTLHMYSQSSDDTAMATQITMLQTPAKIASISSQTSANSAMNGEMFLEKKFIDATAKELHRYNAYLDTVRNYIKEACLLYGLFKESELLVKSFNFATSQIKKYPTNATALALSPSRGVNYAEILTLSVSVLSDFQLLTGISINNNSKDNATGQSQKSKKNKLTEADRMKIEFALRPKFRALSSRLHRLGILVKYTSFASVWHEYTGEPMERSRSDEEILAEVHGKWMDCGTAAKVDGKTDKPQGYNKVSK